MPAHLEWLDADKIGVLRVGKNLFNFKDPYEFSMVIELKDDVAHLIAGNGKLTIEHRTAIFEELFKHKEIKFIIWERIRKNGTTHNVGPFEIEKWRNKLIKNI